MKVWPEVAYEVGLFRNTWNAGFTKQTNSWECLTCLKLIGSWSSVKLLGVHTSRIAPRDARSAIRFAEMRYIEYTKYTNILNIQISQISQIYQISKIYQIYKIYQYTNIPIYQYTKSTNIPNIQNFQQNISLYHKIRIRDSGCQIRDLGCQIRDLGCQIRDVGS